MVTTPTAVVTSPRSPLEETGACAVCAHPIAGHDRISLRFCQATQASAMTRGCACPSS
jgi:hypothetical protein